MPSEHFGWTISKWKPAKCPISIICCKTPILIITIMAGQLPAAWARSKQPSSASWSMRWSFPRKFPCTLPKVKKSASVVGAKPIPPHLALITAPTRPHLESLWPFTAAHIPIVVLRYIYPSTTRSPTGNSCAEKPPYRRMPLMPNSCMSTTIISTPHPSKTDLSTVMFSTKRTNPSKAIQPKRRPTTIQHNGNGQPNSRIATATPFRPKPSQRLRQPQLLMSKHITSSTQQPVMPYARPQLMNPTPYTPTRSYWTIPPTSGGSICTRLHSTGTIYIPLAHTPVYRWPMPTLPPRACLSCIVP